MITLDSQRDDFFRAYGVECLWLRSGFDHFGRHAKQCAGRGAEESAGFGGSRGGADGAVRVLPEPCGVEGSESQPVAIYLAGVVYGWSAAFCAAGERGRSASRCGVDYGFRNSAGTLLRQSGVALDLGAAPQRLHGGDAAVSRAAGEDGVRHRDLPEAAFVAISGTAVHDLSGFHGFAERDGCTELRCGLLRGRVSRSEPVVGRGAEVGAEDGPDPAHVSALRV